MLSSRRGALLMACALVAAGASAESSVSGPVPTQSFDHEYVVTVNGKLDGSIHEELEACGATVTGYLGNGRIIVHGSDEAVRDLMSHEKIASVQVRDARDKIASLVSQDDKRTGRRLTTEEEKKTKTDQILVNLVDAATDKEQVDTETRMKNSINRFLNMEDAVSIEKIKRGRFVLSLPPTCSVAEFNIAMLRAAGFATVSTVEPVLEYHVLNMEGQASTRGTTLTDSSLMNLSGEGEIVGVADTGLDYNMCFFRDDNEEVGFGR